MPNRRHCLLAAAGGLLAAPAWSDTRVVHLVSAPLAPYVFEPGHASGEGIDIDVAREALWRGGGFKLRVSVVPWRRALAMLEYGQADLAPSVRVTPERQRFLAFSQPFGTSVRHAIYTRADSPLSINGLSDLRGLHLGLAAGFELPPPLQAALTGPLERGTDAAAVLGLLLGQRVQAVVLNELPAQWLVRDRGWAGQLKRQAWVFDSGKPTQMAFSKRSTWLATGMAALNNGLALMAHDKAVERITRHYLEG